MSKHGDYVGVRYLIGILKNVARNAKAPWEDDCLEE